MYENLIKKPVGFLVSLTIVVALVIIAIKLIFREVFGSWLGTGSSNAPNKKVDRKDDAGNPIDIGESDKKGFVEIDKTEIKDPLVPWSGETNVDGTSVSLPEDVHVEDVKDVIVINPSIVEVKNNDKSSVDTKNLLDLLRNR